MAPTLPLIDFCIVISVVVEMAPFFIGIFLELPILIGCPTAPNSLLSQSI